MEEHRHGGGFLNGFILGMLVGGGLVFLFGTSKGKKILQMLLEQVEENTQLSELLEMPEDEEEMMGVEDVEPEDEKVISHHEEIKPQKTIAKVKRFFKGSSKKLVS